MCREPKNVLACVKYYRKMQYCVKHFSCSQLPKVARVKRIKNITEPNIQMLIIPAAMCNVHEHVFICIVKLQLKSQLHLHSKSIQLIQELSWSYALYLVFTTTTTTHQYSFLLQ